MEASLKPSNTSYESWTGDDSHPHILEWTKNNSMDPHGHLAWSLAHKDQLLALNSSTGPTGVFNRHCIFCDRYYKHCMFTKYPGRQLLNLPKCKWCKADWNIDATVEAFDVGIHIHCNKRGKPTCDSNWDLAPPAPKSKPTSKFKYNGPTRTSPLTLNTVKAPEIEFMVKGKLGQKERKRLIADKKAADVLKDEGSVAKEYEAL